VNTLSNAQHALSWQALTQAALDIEADVVCIQETNTNWTTPAILTASKVFNNSTYRASKVAVSASKDSTDKNYQPGGTLTAALGRWTARVTGTGSDHSGLGQWSYIEMQGPNHIKYIIASGYKVGPKPPQLGANTVYDQQYRLLLAQGPSQPKPRQQFIDDFIKQVKTWRQQHIKVMICLDANEDTEALNPLKDLGQLIAETDLTDVHENKFPQRPCPATHQRGTRPIDIILASPRFVNAVTAAYILPFGVPITMPGDHRTMGIDLDTQILFGNKSPPPSRFTQVRGVQSNAIPTVQRFCELTVKGWEKFAIAERISPFTHLTTLTPHEHNLLDEIDQDLTHIIVQADRQCAKFRTTPWSPKLHKAYVEHRYWAIQASTLKTGRNYDHLLQQIRVKLGITTNDKHHRKTIQTNLRRIQKLFREIRQDAANHRKAFLDELMIAAKTTKNKQRQQLIRHLKTAEDNRRCFAITKAIKKPQSAGGLTHVLETSDNGNTWSKVVEPADMEQKLLAHSQHHFSQAKGLPYTIAPLNDLLGYDGLTEFGEQVMSGTIPPDIPVPPITKLLLQHQQSLVTPEESTDIPLTFDELMAGFKKWPE